VTAPRTGPDLPKRLLGLAYQVLHGHTERLRELSDRPKGRAAEPTLQLAHVNGRYPSFVGEGLLCHALIGSCLAQHLTEAALESLS
jgi:hypothetical protein